MHDLFKPFFRAIAIVVSIIFVLYVISLSTDTDIIDAPLPVPGVSEPAPTEQREVTTSGVSPPDGSIEEERTDPIDYPPGTDPQYHDHPKTQLMWMQRGQDFVVKNHPEADRAEFRNTFFHRDFKGHATTCGEVRLFKDDEMIEDFQRFLYPGGHMTRLESDFPSFDQLWNKKCVEVLEEYYEFHGLERDP